MKKLLALLLLSFAAQATDFTDEVVFKNPEPAYRFDSSVIDPSAADFRFVGRQFANVNWQDPRANVTYAWGYNAGSSCTRNILTEPSLCWVFESYWVPPGGTSNVEAHLTMFDTNSLEHRMISAMMARNGTGGLLGLKGDKITITAFNSSTPRFQFEPIGGSLFMLDGAGLAFNKNNSPTGAQINAGHTAWLSLPYWDDQNRLRMGASGNWMDLQGNVKVGGFIELPKLAVEPPAPTGNLFRIYGIDDGNGKTKVMVVFGTNPVTRIVIGTQP